ncbi:cell division site-positioning protein MapZ family protein [Enterococcus plantarum]|uniref:cell division site-positioning protein MapZ family protein n=1 Tax=Enterococcus plantarum TaxID=1077675 RepID=UPI001A8F0F18|nr:cell division site-positioning protein MapZ family protein [Enterococcus plantarum]MBO0421793.1 zinc-ribbon domain-containing protein [Enterococcus plantarum]
MTKQCPNCGTELDNQEKVCPECGYSFKDKKIIEDKKPENNTKDKKTEDTSNFLNKEENENIEWSELKDMSIGHVMTMFNEQQPDEKNSEISIDDEKEKIDEKGDETENSVNSSDNRTDELVNTAALDQYINEHKNDKSISKAPTETKKTVEIDGKSELEEESVTIDEESKSKDKGQDEVKSNESDKKTEATDTETEKVNNQIPKEEITKFTKPADNSAEAKTIGPKALPSDTSEIPSKSKKPEEIEMDEAPIFFKDSEEAKSAKNQFKKPLDEATPTKEIKTEPVNTTTGKNYKKMSIILAAVVVLAGGSWFAYSQSQKKSSTGTQVAQKQEKLAEQTEKELKSYFTDDKQLFLKPEMVSVAPKTIKENLDTLKEDSSYKNLETLYKKVTDKQAAITKVNELFAEPIIDGNKLKDVAIKADKKVDLSKREEKDAFDQLLNQATDQAVSQYDQLQKAKAAVDVFYKNNELTDALTRENYATAKSEVDKVKSDTLRKPLSETLVKADKLLTDTEAAIASQQQAYVNQTPAETNETAATDDQGNNAETTTGVQPDSNTFSSPNAQGIYTDPVYSVNAADVSDMSNPAWSWAPGVQEKVIATCIERGYITAGGYSLQPARIINGEGYYNLYGSDNQYLVTINAKTGWFKGNASRNAGR